ncbi:RCC1 domain-containing protein [Burkholderia ubonensis]|uniref:RCC1 domain-containing protein n=1 Tax=Burkholderia ubonensis TaxID=101571 RepID=UPI0007C68F90|nr:RCC1 domain-containing protein [Burkholderia ubonensis]
MKKLLLVGLMAASITAFAKDFLVVVPMPGKATSDSIRVTLAGYALPAAVTGQPYAGFDFKTLLFVTGDPNYVGTGVRWSVVSGSLPDGMTLNDDGTLSGTPTADGTATFQVMARYKSKSGQQTYQVVSLSLRVTLLAMPLPDAVAGTAYSGFDFRPQVSVAGDDAYDDTLVEFSASNLPDGMSLTNGVLSGTPKTKNAPDGSSFQVIASYRGAKGQQTYTILVNGQPLDVVKISSGFAHTCAVTPSGGAKCWGTNTMGQLGNGSTTQSNVPVDVFDLTSGVASISSGAYHTCATSTSGDAKCWGYNKNGQLGNNSTTSSLVPVNVSGLSSGVASISAGYYHTCVRTTSGGAKCWGSNGNGQVGNNAVADAKTPAAVSGLSSGVASIAAGSSHTCAITTSGGAMCWGGNGYGQLGNNSATDSKVPVDVAGLTAGAEGIATGFGHTCASTTSGGAKCWGWNAFGQLGNNGTTDSKVPANVSGLAAGVASITTGYGHSCVVTSAGGLQCWGTNTEGQLGNGGTAQSTVPVIVTGLTGGVASISAGYYHTCALTSTSAAKCWGSNTNGQLGNNSTTRSTVPVDALSN